MGPVPKHWGQLRLLNCRISLVASSTITNLRHQELSAVQHSQYHWVHLISSPRARSRQRFSSHLDQRGSRQQAAQRSVSRWQRRFSMYVGRLSFLYQNKNPVDHIIYNETISCFPDLLRSRGFKLNYYFFLNEFITVPNLMEISKYSNKNCELVHEPKLWLSRESWIFGYPMNSSWTKDLCRSRTEHFFLRCHPQNFSFGFQEKETKPWL